MSCSHPGALWSASVKWNEIQNIFDGANFDCLLLLDSFLATTWAGHGMLDGLPKRFQLLAGSGTNSATTFSTEPSFTAIMASLMSAHVRKYRHINLPELENELSERGVLLHTVPLGFTGYQRKDS